MKKHFNKVILTLSLVSLAQITVAQHNDNQRQFKSKSSGSYEVQLNKFELGNAAKGNFFAQGNIGGVGSYIKDNEILFQVKSLLNHRADKFLVVFNLTQLGSTAEEADNLLNTRMNGFITALKAMGVKDDQVYIDMIYLVPTFEFEVEKKVFNKSYNEVPSGFEMQKNIHISFEDINLVDDMVTLAAKNKIYDLVKLDFFVDETQSMFDTLREKSVDYLNKKLASYKKLNSDLSTTYHVIRESSRTIYPTTQYAAYDAFVTQSLEAVKNKTVTQIRKPKTVAYDQIPYGEFDIIVNPEILQPAVQYVYTLQVKYTLPEPKKEKPKYMLVTPNGDLREVPVE